MRYVNVVLSNGMNNIKKMTFDKIDQFKSVITTVLQNIISRYNFWSNW